MPPIARIGDTTATGDFITGPGVATVLVGGKPVAVVGDMVNGPMCIGSITTGSTVLIGGRPVARVGSTVIGSNPSANGAPITTTVAVGLPSVMVP